MEDGCNNTDKEDKIDPLFRSKMPTIQNHPKDISIPDTLERFRRSAGSKFRRNANNAGELVSFECTSCNAYIYRISNGLSRTPPAERMRLRTSRPCVICSERNTGISTGKFRLHVVKLIYSRLIRELSNLAFSQLLIASLARRVLHQSVNKNMKTFLRSSFSNYLLITVD